MARREVWEIWIEEQAERLGVDIEGPPECLSCDGENVRLWFRRGGGLPYLIWLCLDCRTYFDIE
jgi:hypothetical protein